jgi:hypothetical protein
LISTLSDVVPQGAIAVQHDEKLGTINFRMLSHQAGYHGTTTLKFIGAHKVYSIFHPWAGIWGVPYRILNLSCDHKIRHILGQGWKLNKRYGEVE